jgi:ubiquinone/menaquinone biosynthesis C-methylase UbiE
MVKMDITQIEYPSESFDAIICSHVLEHVQDDRRAMSELYRVLKPGGWAVLQVPLSLSLEKTVEDPSVTSPEERHYRYGQEDHVRIYGRDYTERLEQAGFQVEKFSFAEEFGEGAAQRYGVIRDEKLFIGHKRPQAAAS